MIVVCNTSPLTSLAAIGRFELLRELYAHISIASGVWDELNAGEHAWPGSHEVATASWVTQHSVQNESLVTALRRDLDRGEAETIALALELDADLILLDEKPARQYARSLQLNVAGVLGVLLDAKAHNLLETIQPALDDLRQLGGFYVSDALYAKIWRLRMSRRRQAQSQVQRS